MGGHERQRKVEPGLFIYINCAFGLFQSRRSLIEKGIRSPLSTTLKDDFRQRKENTRTSESVSTSTVVASSASSAAVTESTQRSFDWTEDIDGSSSVYTLENNDEFRSKILWRKFELYRKSSFISRWVGK